ncbi:MAG: Holliday junction resolvase RuvX [Halioglobus sp.]|nr:Holliday junction resolvase RuvX [Halioglobus sp.]
MALDFGLSQIGVAVGNCQLGSSQPLPILRARDGIPDWQTLEARIAEWRPDLLVVGDPINMDGSDSPMSIRARKFARRLQARLALEVILVDERLTSFEAKIVSRARGHKGDYRKRPVDSLAAMLILRTWLAENDSR